MFFQCKSYIIYLDVANGEVGPYPVPGEGHPLPDNKRKWLYFLKFMGIYDIISLQYTVHSNYKMNNIQYHKSFLKHNYLFLKKLE